MRSYICLKNDLHNFIYLIYDHTSSKREPEEAHQHETRLEPAPCGLFFSSKWWRQGDKRIFKFNSYKLLLAQRFVPKSCSPPSLS